MEPAGAALREVIEEVRAKPEAPLGNGDHVVKFYEDDHQLSDVAAGYFAASLDQGHALLIFAESAHEAMFRSQLQQIGTDVAQAERDGSLSFAGAGDLANLIVVDGRVDEARFDSHIAEPVRRAIDQFSSVRVYGEIVSVLWQWGNVTGAIELEGHWNRLAASVPFALFCSYPSRLSGEAESFQEICSLHSAVLQQMPDSRGEVSRYFQGTLEAPRLARRFVTGVLERWDRPELLADAAIVVSELTTNSVVHGSSDFIVGVSRHEGVVRVEVIDHDSTPPVIQSGADNPAGGGRGLRVVSEVSRSWGHELLSGGKSVWAEVG